MKNILLMLPLFFTLHVLGSSAVYKVVPGSLHRKGRVIVSVLPDTDKFKVRMDFDVAKKDLVPVPAKLLKGSKVMDFPNEFRSEKGYKELESKKTMEIPKAVLKFIRRGDDGPLKDAYFIEVHPTNKKSKIDIVYHPTIPSVGWNRVKITFISPFPVLDGYVLEAELNK